MIGKKKQILRAEKQAHIRVIQHWNLSHTGLEHMEFNPEFTAMIPHCRSIDLSHNRLNSANPKLIELFFFTLALDKKYLSTINLSHTRFIGLLQNKNLMDNLIKSFQDSQLRLLNLEHNQLGQSSGGYSWENDDPYFKILMHFLTSFKMIDYLLISDNQFSLTQISELYILTEGPRGFFLPIVHHLQCKEHEKNVDESETMRPLTQREQCQYIQKCLKKRRKHTHRINIEKNKAVSVDIDEKILKKMKKFH